MDQGKVFGLIISALVAGTLIIGIAAAHAIMQTKWTKDLVQISLERGQNPMYVKCAMESNPSNECKTLVTALAVAKSDK